MGWDPALGKKTCTCLVDACVWGHVYVRSSLEASLQRSMTGGWRRREDDQEGQTMKKSSDNP